jgi:hypothetical protein
VILHRQRNLLTGTGISMKPHLCALLTGDEDDLRTFDPRPSAWRTASTPPLLREATRIAGGIVALLAGLLGLLASMLDLGIVDGLDGTIAALGVVNLAPDLVAGRVQVASARAAGAFTFSALTTAFAVLAICLQRRWPGACILISALVGSVLGWHLTTVCMFWAIAGGALVLIGSEHTRLPHRM